MTDNLARQETFEKTPALIALETRIRTHLTYAYDQIVEVGRCLNEAKEQKLVPHGQWESWVNEVVGMDARMAQRWMQIAREVPAGSVMASLGYTQIRAILTLPEAEREPMAQKAKDEGLTVRQLQLQIDRLKFESGTYRQNALDAEKRVLEIKQDAKRNIDKLMDEIDELKSQSPASAGISAEAQSKIDELTVKLKNAEQIANVANEKRRAAVQELNEAREMANVQSEKRRAAEHELIELKKTMAEAPESGYHSFDIDALMAAVRDFISRAGELPHMGTELSGMNDKRRRDFERCVALVSDWVDGSRNALNALVIEG